MTYDPNRPVGYESRKAYARRCASGFWDRYIRGPVVLDIGFRGGVADAVPIVEGAIGVEPDGFWIDPRTSPPVVLDMLANGIGKGIGYDLLAKGVGYDGLRLPFEEGSVDTVHASHMLEHAPPGVPPYLFIREWLRVLRVGGTLILMVPHEFLYERRMTVPPSRWSPEHNYSYAPQQLLVDIHLASPPNTWRLRHMEDDDTGYDYSLPIDVHPVGSLEIVCVIEKITPPAWKVEP